MPIRLRVIDIETTGIAPPDHAIVEIAFLDVLDGVLGARGARILNPERPIPPEASAVHHITDADVATAPEASYAFLHELHADRRPDAFVSHCASFERQWLDEHRDPEIPWVCTMKCAMRAWPDAPKFSNQVLRYWLSLGDLGPDAWPPHRALPDCVITAHILLRLLEHAPIERLIEWSYEPPLRPRIEFGKHAGLPFSEIPADYLEWMLRQQDMDWEVVWRARYELERRADLRRAAYLEAALPMIAACQTVIVLYDWFQGEARARERHGVTKGTPEHQRLVDACSARKAAIVGETAA